MENSEVFSIYSDESGIFNKRFQAIALISGSDMILLQLKKKLKDILDENGIDEIKFEEVRTHHPKLLAAQSFIDCSVRDYASQQKCRIDVLVWDTQDPRHAVEGRDDIANLGVMYYRLLTHTARQLRQTEWHLYPDINPDVDWDKIADFLNKTRLAHSRTILPSLFDLKEENQLIKFKEIQPRDSLCEPLIQLADLFAGIARFTREEGEQCLQWLNSWGNKDQLKLPDFICGKDEIDDTIGAKQNRYKLIGDFYDLCRRKRMGVSLRDKRYLRTPNPTNPINFWNYEPQHEFDIAPKRID